MRTNCRICGSPAPHSFAPENNKHIRAECPKCGTYRMDERSDQRLGERVASQIEAGVEAPRHRNHEALSAVIRAKYDASGQQEVFIDDFDALEREAAGM
jgi:PHP family Zn ribbon phosphoesterase